MVRQRIAVDNTFEHVTQGSGCYRLTNDPIVNLLVYELAYFASFTKYDPIQSGKVISCHLYCTFIHVYFRRETEGDRRVGGRIEERMERIKEKQTGIEEKKTLLGEKATAIENKKT